MGFLGVDQKEFDNLKHELNNFKIDVLSKITILDGEIKAKITDSEEQARTSAANADVYSQSAKSSDATVREIISKLEQCLASVQLESENFQKQKIETSNIVVSIKNSESKAIAILGAITEKQDEITSSATRVIEKSETLNEEIEKCKDLPSNLEEAKTLLESASKINSDIEGLLGHSMKRKAEIDTLFKSIYGHDVKNSAEETEHIDGVKDALEKTYTELAQKINDLNSVTNKSIQVIADDYKLKLNDSISGITTLLSDSEAKIISVSNKLTGLLPGAMAEGLSAAYEAKKDEEIKSQTMLEKNFKLAIACMVGVSVIPFAVDSYLLFWMGSNLVSVIKDTPNLILAILPLYFPILWFALSSNKKLNLSKRLIEEYTHKATLGKTFSGLSNQIESFSQDGDVKDELRARLLFNFLQVTSENPGKLITNYERSDHPLMEALENSSKLSASVDALARIPGFSSIAAKLAKKSDELLKGQANKVASGFAYQNALDDKA